MNQVVLVGRLTKEPELLDSNGKKRLIITLAVNRPYKNSDGIYQSDFIRCILWDGVATNTAQYSHKGDVIGIKGRLETCVYEDKENQKKILTEVIAERVTFLSSNSK